MYIHSTHTTHFINTKLNLVLTALPVLCTISEVIMVAALLTITHKYARS
jgi:hypothetical protein